jgi:hypothetical protein
MALLAIYINVLQLGMHHLTGENLKGVWAELSALG